MNYRRAIDLYAQFLAHYAQVSPLAIVQASILSDGRTMTGSMIPFKESAADFLHELFNSIRKRKVFRLALFVTYQSPIGMIETSARSGSGLVRDQA